MFELSIISKTSIIMNLKMGSRSLGPGTPTPLVGTFLGDKTLLR
jgi:hypothetical protein